MVENNIFAYNLGARIFEKHIAIDEGEERIDYISAIGKDKFLKLVSSIKNFKINKNNNSIEVDLDYLSESEIIYRNREKFAVASRNLKKGEVINPQMIKYKLIDSGIGYTPNDVLPESKLTRDIFKDDIILKTDFSDH